MPHIGVFPLVNIAPIAANTHTGAPHERVDLVDATRVVKVGGLSLVNSQSESYLNRIKLHVWLDNGANGKMETEG